MSAVQEFKEFVLRGNVVDLAVGVIIGGAFGAIVKAFVDNLVTPLIGIFVSDPKHPANFDQLDFKVHGSSFLIGNFINTIVAFLIIAAVVFFLVVKPINYLMSRQKKADDPEVAPELTREEVLLTEIRDSLRARV